MTCRKTLPRSGGRLGNIHRDDLAASVALRCAGAPDSQGDLFRLTSLAGRTRWLLAAGSGTAGPFGQGLYRPISPLHHVVARYLDAAHALGRGRTVRLDPAQGIAPALADTLGVNSVVIAGAALARDGGARVVLKLVHGDTTLAYAKIDEDADSLEHEHRVLTELARICPRAFIIPRSLGFVTWNGITALVLEPLPSLSVKRTLAAPEIAALAELWELRDELAGVLGSVDGEGPAHGDFAPWNAGHTRTGLAVVWDWEQARVTPPLEDYFHWHTQCLALLGTSTVASLVNRALRPDNELRELCSRLGVPEDDAPSLLRSYLSRSSTWTETAPASVNVRLRALELLDRITP